MSGLDAIQDLQKNPDTRGIPVIAVSANAMTTQINDALKAGFVDYITKPIDISRFLQTIDTHLVKYFD
jgi:CheY-like chemotaxis protein